jgi:hypothetical protein
VATRGFVKPAMPAAAVHRHFERAAVQVDQHLQDHRAFDAFAQRIAGAFPSARAVRGDRFASVATGLGLHAQRVFKKH